MKTKKKRVGGGGFISPRKKNQNRNQFVFLSFWLDSLNWQSFIEIGKMAVVRGLGALVDTLLNHSLQEKIREVELKLLP